MISARLIAAALAIAPIVAWAQTPTIEQELAAIRAQCIGFTSPTVPTSPQTIDCVYAADDGVWARKGLTPMETLAVEEARNQVRAAAKAGLTAVAMMEKFVEFDRAMLDKLGFKVERLAQVEWAQIPTAAEIGRAYPDNAERARIPGRVILTCLVGLDGYVKDCQVADFAPRDQGFDKAALALAARFKAKPVRLNGARIGDIPVIQPMIFVPG